MIDVYVVSAFSKGGSGGNKAGVVLHSKNLSEQEKTKIAFQLGYSETAFVSLSQQADFKLEYYTPVGEVPLCGHATIGTFKVLNDLHMLEKSVYTIETKSSILKIMIEKDGLVFMEQNAPKFYEKIAEKDIEGCLRAGKINQAFPIQIVSTGLRDIMVPIATTDVLARMVPDFEMISRISEEKNCVGIHAFAVVEDAAVTAVCRNFAPLYGIKEESATGTSNCALACYLYKYGIRRKRYTFEQGYNLNSISRIYVKIESSNDIIEGVYVGGNGDLLEMQSIAV